MEPSATEHQSSTAIVDRYFTTAEVSPYDVLEWKTADVEIGEHKQKGVEAPADWGQNAINIVSKLYFATVDGERETSVRQLIHRVAYKITVEGIKHGYFSDKGDGGLVFTSDEAQVFYDELSHLLLNQMAAFNTPVWLNVGVPDRKQCCSACYPLRVEDSMIDDDHSILDWVATESKIFKSGAGAGINVSKLRGSMEMLSGGGVASGPVPYMRFADAGAGTLKSGGRARRAAKMVILDADHPDVRDFIQCKVREDERMRILADAGVNMDPFTAEGERNIAESTSFQNANQSINCSNAFMEKVISSDSHGWDLTARVTGAVVDTVDVRTLFEEIAQATWKCGDPGVVFLDTVNDWHTTPAQGQSTTCNPCGEYWSVDDSACNLASLNLIKFIDLNGDLMIDDYEHAINVMATAMDITCSFSELPTEAIEDNTRKLRQLGLGYANLGGALMSKGLAYDSVEGRRWASGVTALLTGRAYARSAELAGKLGSYHYFESNRDAHLRVIAKHEAALGSYPLHDDPEYKLWSAAHSAWATAVRLGNRYGYRNAQATVLAPTGTCALMMGCDTTGVEPAFSLVAHKGLAGGGSMTLINSSVERAMRVLGYSYDEEHDVACIERTGYPGVLFKHKAVFAGANDISADGHLDMVIALAPLLSGSASKSINLPESATPEDIKQIYIKAWQGGLKAISVYRNNSKVVQVLSNKPKEIPATPETWPIVEREEEQIPVVPPDLSQDPDTTSELGRKGIVVTVEQINEALATSTPGYEAWEPIMRMWFEREQNKPARARMNRERQSLTHKVELGGHEGYLTAGMYEDGSLGEIFLTGMGKEGTFLQGMMGAWSIAISIGLQYGVPLEVFARKFVGMEFEPKGATGLPEFPDAKSLVDYCFRWIASRFLEADECEELGVLTPQVKRAMAARLDAAQAPEMVLAEPHQVVAVMGTINHLYGSGNGHMPEAISTRPCSCGGIAYPSGTCFTCSSCGVSLGGCG